MCNTPAQLPVWLISSSSKLKANTVPRIKISRDDNSVIPFQFITDNGPLCPFTDTSLCRLGRYRLQIWEEPLRNLVTWFVHNATTLYAHNCQTVLARTRNTPVRFSLVRAVCPNQKKRARGTPRPVFLWFRPMRSNQQKIAQRAPAYPIRFSHGLLGASRARRPRPKY